MLPGGTRLLTRSDVAALLTLTECTRAVEAAFATHARGGTLATHAVGVAVEGGGFHIKASGLREPPVFVAKVNGNFGENEPRFGMPRIQGVIVLCDARNGYPLAVMDSTVITAMRTAAATGVATRHLARADAATATIVGCGRQSRLQLRAVAAERRLARVFAYDVDLARARAFAQQMGEGLGIQVEAVDCLTAATRRSEVVVTCTSSTRAILGASDVMPGAFIAAVGADSESKQEIDPGLLATAVVIPDLLEQAATIGDLHHALRSGAMRREQVRAELGAVVAGLAAGRVREDEIVVFDSTGAALQDVAAAGLVYERAVQAGRGLVIDLVGGERAAPVWPRPRISI
jgi:alanine dehydrogenase